MPKEADSMTTNTARQDLRDAYREVVLNLAGVLSVHDAGDDLVWAVFRSLDEVFESRLSRDAETEFDSSPTQRRRPHPAVIEILSTLDRHARPAEPLLEKDGKRTAPGDGELVRLPGLLRRWEIARVLEPGSNFHIEQAATAPDGTPLYAVYRLELDNEKEA